MILRLHNMSLSSQIHYCSVSDRPHEWMHRFLPHTLQHPLFDLTPVFGPGKKKTKKEGRETLTFILCVSLAFNKTDRLTVLQTCYEIYSRLLVCDYCLLSWPGSWIVKGRARSYSKTRSSKIITASSQTPTATVVQQNTHNNKIYDNTFSAHQFP